MNQKNIERIAQHFGYENQQEQLVEELSELILAIQKSKRYKDCNDTELPSYIKKRMAEENLNEELADVLVVMKQIIFLLGNDEEVSAIAERKINRTLEIIAEEGKNNRYGEDNE